jgi:hypothetical protein
VLGRLKGRSEGLALLLGLSKLIHPVVEVE